MTVTTALVALLGRAVAGAAARPLVERAAQFSLPQYRIGVNPQIDAKLYEFAESIRAELARVVERHGVDQESAKSFSTVQLLIRAVRAVVEEQDEAKRSAYARLLARSVDRKWTSRYGRIEQALRTVIDCSEDDFKILGAVIKVREESSKMRVEHLQAIQEGRKVVELTGEGAPEEEEWERGELSATRIAAAAEMPVNRVVAHTDRLQRLGLVRMDRGGVVTEIDGQPSIDERWGTTTPLLEELSQLLAAD